MTSLLRAHPVIAFLALWIGLAGIALAVCHASARADRAAERQARDLKHERERLP